MSTRTRAVAAVAAGVAAVPLMFAGPAFAGPSGGLLQPLAPVLQPVGGVVKPLAPVLQPVGGVLQPVGGLLEGSGAVHWNDWLGSDSTNPATTLAQVRGLIGADTGVAAPLTGKGVGIALIDTGVAPVAGLPAAQIVNGPDLSFESQADNLRYLDAYGHGTHMAGIIVGKDAATGATGLAPGAKLTSIKVGTANGAVDVSQVIAAVDWVVEHRNDDPANPIKVINLSYGSGGTPDAWNDSLGFAVEKAWRSGIVVVAAAGNDGNDAGSQANPALNEWVLSVGSADTKGTAAVTDDTLAPFTNLPANGGKQVNVLAPGVSILSLRDPGSYIDTEYAAARVGTTLFRGSGTSQSAAITSAAVALIRQAKPTATPDQIKDWLVKSATRVPNGVASDLGLRQINVNAALARTTAAPAQTWNRSLGTGSLDAARGESRVVFDGVALGGDRAVWGPLTMAVWALKAGTGDSWVGGTWMGYQVAGSGWTGSSWASRTWAPAVWSNSRPWSGATTWQDPDWSARTWSARTWSARTWSARTWSARTWSSDNWSSTHWG